jgi:large subunit ribosomal protein L23
MDLTYILKRPIVTEKSTLRQTQGEYTFEVDRRATKRQIAKAVENAFGVHVKGVQIMTVRGKKRRIGRTRREIRQPDWKKAIVKLAEEEKIDVFETGG